MIKEVILILFISLSLTALVNAENFGYNFLEAGFNLEPKLCIGDQVILGNGSCISTSTFGVGIIDTNASTECSGDEVLLGNASCISTSGFGVGGVDNSSWNQSGATATFGALFVNLTGDTMTGPLIGTSFNGSFNWTEISKYLTFTGGSILNFVEAELNATIDDKLKTIFYNATSIHLVSGTLDAGDVESTWMLGDGDSYNISELNNQDWIIYVNWTGIINFDGLTLSYWYNPLDSKIHHVHTCLWNWGGSFWDCEYQEIDPSKHFVTLPVGVFDAIEHIGTGGDAGEVRLSLRHDSLGDKGRISHEFYLDYAQLSLGFTGFTPTGVPNLQSVVNVGSDIFGVNIISNANSTWDWINAINGNFTNISSLDWDNVTITESQISDLSHFNTSYAGSLNNASYLSIFNESYDSHVNLTDGAGAIINVTTAGRIVSTNSFGFRVDRTGLGDIADIRAIAGEGDYALLTLWADEADNDADGMRVIANPAGLLELQVKGSGSWASGLSIGSTTRNISIPKHVIIGETLSVGSDLLVKGTGDHVGEEKLFVDSDDNEIGMTTQLLIIRPTSDRVILNMNSVAVFRKITNDDHFDMMPAAGSPEGFVLYDTSTDGENNPFDIHGQPSGQLQKLGRLKIVAGTSTARFAISTTGEAINIPENVVIHDNVTIGKDVLPTYPLEVWGSTGSISIWAEANVSATGYETRTPSLSDYQGNYLSLLKSPLEMLDLSGKLKREDLFEKEATLRTVKDMDKPVYYNTTVYDCWEDDEGIEICGNITVTTADFPHIKTEEGMMVDTMVVNNRLLISELKQENQMFKDCTASSKDFNEYKLCVGL